MKRLVLCVLLAGLGMPLLAEPESGECPGDKKAGMQCPLNEEGQQEKGMIGRPKGKGPQGMGMMGPKGEEQFKKRFEKMSEKLGLNAEQKAKMEQILKEGLDKIREERKAALERMKKIRKDTDSRIEKVLTPEQMKKFKKMEDKQIDKAGKKRMKP